MRGFEFRDGALFVFDFEGGLKDEGEVLELESIGISTGSAARGLPRRKAWSSAL